MHRQRSYDVKNPCKWCQNHNIWVEFSKKHYFACPFFNCKCETCSYHYKPKPYKPKLNKPKQELQQRNCSDERSQFCIFCKHHGFNIYAKGQHPKFCKFRECKCTLCSNSREPQYCSFCKNHGYYKIHIGEHVKLCGYRKSCSCKQCEKDRRKIPQDSSSTNSTSGQSRKQENVYEAVSAPVALKNVSESVTKGEQPQKRKRSESPCPEPTKQAKTTESVNQPPNCQYCYNHGWKFPMKEHHRSYCMFKDCSCEACEKISDKKDPASSAVGDNLKAQQEEEKNTSNGSPMCKDSTELTASNKVKTDSVPSDNTVLAVILTSGQISTPSDIDQALPEEEPKITELSLNPAGLEKLVESTTEPPIKIVPFKENPLCKGSGESEETTHASLKDDTAQVSPNTDMFSDSQNVDVAGFLENGTLIVVDAVETTENILPVDPDLSNDSQLEQLRSIKRETSLSCVDENSVDFFDGESFIVVDDLGSSEESSQENIMPVNDDTSLPFVKEECKKSSPVVKAKDQVSPLVEGEVSQIMTGNMIENGSLAVQEKALTDPVVLEDSTNVSSIADDEDRSSASETGDVVRSQAVQEEAQTTAVITEDGSKASSPSVENDNLVTKDVTRSSPAEYEASPSAVQENTLTSPVLLEVWTEASSTVVEDQDNLTAPETRDVAEISPTTEGEVRSLAVQEEAQTSAVITEERSKASSPFVEDVVHITKDVTEASPAEYEASPSAVQENSLTSPVLLEVQTEASLTAVEDTHEEISVEDHNVAGMGLSSEGNSPGLTDENSLTSALEVEDEAQTAVDVVADETECNIPEVEEAEEILSATCAITTDGNSMKDSLVESSDKNAAKNSLEMRKPFAVVAPKQRSIPSTIFKPNNALSSVTETQNAQDIEAVPNAKENLEDRRELLNGSSSEACLELSRSLESKEVEPQDLLPALASELRKNTEKGRVPSVGSTKIQDITSSIGETVSFVSSQKESIDHPSLPSVEKNLTLRQILESNCENEQVSIQLDSEKDHISVLGETSSLNGTDATSGIEPTEMSTAAEKEVASSNLIDVSCGAKNILPDICKNLVADLAKLGQNYSKAVPFKRSVSTDEVSQNLLNLDKLKAFRRNSSIAPVTSNLLLEVNKQTVNYRKETSNQEDSTADQLCHVCGKSFTGLNLFQLHVLSHSNETVELKAKAPSILPGENNTQENVCRPGLESSNHDQVLIANDNCSNSCNKEGNECIKMSKEKDISSDEHAGTYDVNESMETSKDDEIESNEEDDSNFFCHLCGKGGFPTHLQFRLHLYLKHGIDSEKSDEPHCCNVCPFQGTEIAVRDHESAHMEILPLERLLFLFGAIKNFRSENSLKC